MVNIVVAPTCCVIIVGHSATVEDEESDVSYDESEKWDNCQRDRQRIENIWLIDWLDE